MQVQIKYRRPAKITAYKKQLEFIDAPARFTVVEATSKAGKTSGCIVWLFEQALSKYGTFHPDPSGLGVVYNQRITPNEHGNLDKTGFNYWWVAPTFSVAKIAFSRLKRYIKNKDVFTANESELSITLINGAKLWFKSADKPDTLYGEDVHAVVIDEASRMKEDAWTAILSTLTATKGNCKIIGNVKGDDNWFYKASRETQERKPERKNWLYYKITADDAVQAGVLDMAIIEDARGSLPEGEFLQLFYGIPFTKGADQFAYSFDIKKHVKACQVDYNYPVYLSFDFNINPVTCTVIQMINGVIKIPLVIKMHNSNIYALCKKIKTVLPFASFIVNGDATGLNTNALVEDNLNYYEVIKDKLDLGAGQIQLTTNPVVSQNQVLVNAVLEHMPHEIDPAGAAALVFDLQKAKMGKDGKLIKKDRSKVEQQLEALDGYRYFVNRNLRGILKGYHNI